ncbi:restriction endonuclease subunit S [Falsiroseomonas sp. CW058]|uniref:restriction endonuclease subunit S n=1 Tax=Falsiroseomonas sp. CW058 TaxID=3388664 RepID=UPI003D322BA4
MVWQVVPLDSVAQVGAGNAAPQDPRLFADGIVPFIRTSDVGRIRFGTIAAAEDWLNADGATGLRRWPAGTILFPKSGASTFLNHRVMTEVEACVASHLATIVPKADRVEPRFLLHFLGTVDAKALTQDQGYPSLRLPEIGAIPVPLPPLAEQQRIAAILDEAFEGIASANANAERNIANAKELFVGQLNRLFAEIASRAPAIPLAQLGAIQTGSTPKSSETGMKGTAVPFIKPGDFRPDGSLDYDNEGLSERGLAAARTVPAGSALMVCIGATIGKAGYAERTVTTNQQINTITPQPGISGKFLHYQMKTERFQQAVMSSSAQATLPIINKSKWSALTIALPASLDEQEAVVADLEALWTATDELVGKQRAKLAALAELRVSLLNHAFSGQLTRTPAIAA